MLIQAQPSNPANSFLRFEFNPRMLNPKAMAFFKSKLFDFLGPWWTFDDLVGKGKVTRVDIACDIVNCSVKDLIVQFAQPSKSHAYFGVDDEIESVYLGITPDKTNSHHYVYNKRQAQKDKGRTAKYGGVPWTRVETRLITQRTLPKLKSMSADPFEKFTIYCTSQAKPPEAAYHWLFFTDSCRQRGVDNALAQLPSHLQKLYSAALSKAQQDFWRPARLWKHWPIAINRAGF